MALRKGTRRQVLIFAAIFTVLTVGFDLVRGVTPGRGTAVAVAVAAAVYAGLLWLRDRRKGGNGEDAR